MERLRMLKQLILTCCCVVLAAHAQGTYGPITKQDRLWRVALAVRSSSVYTPQQVIMALAKKNPKAFRFGNINGLVIGETLQVPTPQEMGQHTPARAMQFVDEQNRSWHNTYRSLAMAQDRAKQPLSLAKQTPVQPQLPDATFEKTLQAELARAVQAIALHQRGAFQRLQVELTAELQVIHDEQARMQHAWLQAMHQWHKEREAMQHRALFAGPLTSNAVLRVHDGQEERAAPGMQAMLGVVLAFLMALGLPVASTRSHAKKSSGEDSGDYDYLNSEEGLAAKLDLARAYMAMEDHEQAFDTLQEVVAQGSPEQQQEAHALLKQLKQTPCDDSTD